MILTRAGDPATGRCRAGDEGSLVGSRQGERALADWCLKKRNLKASDVEGAGSRPGDYHHDDGPGATGNLKGAQCALAWSQPQACGAGDAGPETFEAAA